MVAGPGLMPPFAQTLASRLVSLRVGHLLLTKTSSSQNMTLSHILSFVSRIILSSLTSNPGLPYKMKKPERYKTIRAFHMVAGPGFEPGTFGL